MPKYLILPIERPDTFKRMSPQEMQGIVERYIQWTRTLGKQKKLVSGEKLVDGEGKVLRRQGAKLLVTDGPHTESKELLGGFWIIQAKSYDEAEQLCADCPHLEYGTIVIRQIEKN
jgi:hypothetical protein